METIYQISTFPICEDDYITASDYEDSWFVPSIAEYVRDTADRQLGVRALLTMLESKQMATVNHETNSFMLLPNVQSIYFEGRYSRFRKLLAALSRVQEDRFIYYQDEIEGLLLQLNGCFSEQFGAYIAGNNEGLIPLDEFIRTADEGVTYYVGGIVDYHL